MYSSTWIPRRRELAIYTTTTTTAAKDLRQLLLNEAFMFLVRLVPVAVFLLWLQLI